MKQTKNKFIILGFVMYLVLSSIDRFIYKIPNYIYIPFALIGVILIIIGIIKTKNRRR